MTIAHRPLRLPLLWLCSLIFISLAGCQQLKRPFSDAPQMTDAEIIHVARTLNQGEIDTSKPAVEKASNAKVREFAQRMVSDHQKEIQNLEREAREARLTPLPNDTSSKLQKKTQEMTVKLKTQEGQEFDKTYMKGQIKLHEQALSKLDDTLIPAAQNGRIRGYLTQMRTIVNQHLIEAKSIEQSLP